MARNPSLYLVALVAVLIAGGLTSSSASSEPPTHAPGATAPDSLIVAREGGTGFPVEAGAPLSFGAGDTFSFVRTETVEGRHLVRFLDAGTAYRADAHLFGIEEPDPFEVALAEAREGSYVSAYRDRRYAHGAVNVRSGPGTNHSQVRQLGRDEGVYVLACHGGWCLLYRPGGTTSEREYVSESLLHDSMAPARTYTAPSGSRAGSSRSVAVRCSGTTQRGTRCLRRTTNASGRCWQH